MAKHVIKSDRNTQWMIDADGDTWVIEKQASITVTGADAVFVQMGSDDNRFVVDGDISADVTAHAAIRNNGDGNIFIFGRKARIEGEQALVGGGDDTTIVNAGLITSTNVSLAQNQGFNLTNKGEIGGETFGISVAQADLILNKKDAEIGGDVGGIRLFGDGRSRIVNEGVISGGDYSILDEDGSISVVNKGRIEGDIYLGGGDDVLQSLKGEVAGAVHGGDGHDIYRISQSNLEIVENVDEGGDRVFSTATFALPDNVEALYLRGSTNIDATGNEAANLLIGNRGANTLHGLGGGDLLRGGAGKDRLAGGDGGDTFLFRENDGKEIVTDFQLNVDGINIAAVEGLDNWADVRDRLEQHGSDVWLSGDGTTMVFKNIDILSLDQSHFSFGPA